MRVESVGPADVVPLVGPDWKPLLPKALEPGDGLYALRDESRVAGFAWLKRLPFDSDVFGVPVGRLVARAQGEVEYERILGGVIDEAKSSGCHQLVTTIPGEQHIQLGVLENLGFRLVDVGLVFRRRLDRGGFVTAAAPAELPVRVALDADLERLMDMAGTLFRSSRFYRDPMLTAERADELHRRWIRNCLLNGRADAILVATDEGDVPIGFVTCKAERERGFGTIDLVAVDPRHRERGVASAVLGASLRWFAARTGEVRVKTQATNYGASRLYERVGFRLIANDLTLVHAL